METKFEKLQSYQENASENKEQKAERNKKKSSSVKGPIITGLESHGRITMSMSGVVSKERWDKIFGKKSKQKDTNKKA